jgi:hypothetical protein
LLERGRGLLEVVLLRLWQGEGLKLTQVERQGWVVKLVEDPAVATFLGEVDRLPVLPVALERL